MYSVAVLQQKGMRSDAFGLGWSFTTEGLMVSSPVYIYIYTMCIWGFRFQMRDMGSMGQACYGQGYGLINLMATPVVYSLTMTVRVEFTVPRFTAAARKVDLKVFYSLTMMAAWQYCLSTLPLEERLLSIRAAHS